MTWWIISNVEFACVFSVAAHLALIPYYVLIIYIFFLNAWPSNAYYPIVRPFYQLPLPWCFIFGGLIRLCWDLPGTITWHVPGLLWHALLAHSGLCLGGPYPCHCPPTCLLHQLGMLPLLGYYFWYHLRSQFSVCFHCGAPDWCVSGVPCSSMSLVFWLFSGAIALLPTAWPYV